MNPVTSTLIGFFASNELDAESTSLIKLYLSVDLTCCGHLTGGSHKLSIEVAADTCCL